MTAARVLSIRTGRVRELARPNWDRHRERAWQTAYFKDEVAGPVRVSALGIEGDEQYDRGSHGGVEMALLAYAESSYALWRAEPGRDSFGPGGFGENLVLEGSDESSVCIGDAWECATLRLEVSQPRGPCSNISRRWNDPNLLKRVVETGRTGWYLRVLSEGMLERGDTLALAERPHPEWTVNRVFRVKTNRDADPGDLKALAALEALSPEWREYFSERASRIV